MYEGCVVRSNGAIRHYYKNSKTITCECERTSVTATRNNVWVIGSEWADAQILGITASKSDAEQIQARYAPKTASVLHYVLSKP